MTKDHETKILHILSSIPHNKHYLIKYLNFLKKYSNTNKHNEYTENHHICPKALFPEYKNLKIFSWNKCVLTARQHFISHYILYKVFGGSMIFALFKMSNQCRISLYSKKYEKLKHFRCIESKRNKWWHNPKTNELKFCITRQSKEFIRGRGKGYNTNKTLYYDPLTLNSIFLDPTETPPKNFIKGTPKSTQSLWYNLDTKKSKYFQKNIIPEGNYIKGSPNSATWRYKNNKTGEIFISKMNNLHETDNNIIRLPSLKNKKCFYNPITLEMKYFFEEDAPEGWINKNIKQMSHTKTKNRKWYHDDLGNTKMFYPNNVPTGWKKGRKHQ